MSIRSAVVRVAMSLCVVGLGLAAPAVAGAAAPAYSNGHAYRHGVVPFRGHQHTIPFNAPGMAATSTNNLGYGGGVSSVGVTTGPERIYLVFLGSQWGTQSTDSSGYASFSGDPSGVAPRLQAFFAGLGTGGETWSGVMTQYCQGVSTGAQSCPSSNTAHVGYPTGGALAGVWEDTSSSAPSAASAHQLAAEAVNAAKHFGNTTSAANRDAQYVVVSPTGTNPDGYKSAGFCAWHDYTGDSTLDGGGGVSTPWGSPIAFTNLPYIPDVGTTCGKDFVNSGSAGALDGVTIVEGHEYAETITDQFPSGGWTDSSTAENGDKCAWIRSGQGAAQDISLTTGAFAVQSTWANDWNGGAGGCEISHPIVTDPVVTSCTAAQLLGNPGFETGSAAPWTATAGVIESNGAGETAHSGNWYAWLGAARVAKTYTLAQTVTIAAGCHTDTLSFWLWIDTSEVTSSAIDKLKVQVLNSSGTVLATLASYSNLNANNAYVQKSFDVSAYAGQTIKLKFKATDGDTAGGNTNFVIDDTALNQAS